MASITTDKATGARTVQFVGGDKKRRSIRLGKVPLRAAEQVRLRVELLQAAITTGTAPDAETSRWVAELPDDLHSKLAGVGLVAARLDSQTVSGFIRSYIASRTDLKGRTLNNLDQAAGYIIEFFGENKPLTAVTPGDGDDMRRWMLERLAENTARRHCGRAKQFFRAAFRKRLIPFDPLADLKDCGMRVNRSRMVFLDENLSRCILDECPTLQWKVIWTLARWGGLRMPSEGIRLTWQDIDFEAGTMLIHSPKTERHEGREMRLVPLFPECRMVLDELREQVQPGIDVPMSAAVIQGFDRETNWRTRLHRMLVKAGLPALPKPFVNARASRATELAEIFPGHVAAAWLGHTERIADKHYRQITADHLKRATAPKKAVQNPVQYRSEPGGMAGKWKSGTPEFPEDSALFHRITEQEYPRHDSNVRPAV